MQISSTDRPGDSNWKVSHSASDKLFILLITYGFLSVQSWMCKVNVYFIHQAFPINLFLHKGSKFEVNTNQQTTTL